MYTGDVREILRTDWRPGSAAEPPGPVLVSVTDYTSNRAIDLAGISVAGLRLRRHWPALPGAKPSIKATWLKSVPAYFKVVLLPMLISLAEAKFAPALAICNG